MTEEKCEELKLTLRKLIGPENDARLKRGRELDAHQDRTIGEIKRLESLGLDLRQFQEEDVWIGLAYEAEHYGMSRVSEYLEFCGCIRKH